jgi:heterodisulfide reductase subunit A
MKENAKKPALVVGSGVAGMKAALDLAASGVPVLLLEQKPSVGGVLCQLDRWFPDDSCNLCQILPGLSREIEFCTRTYFRYPNIELLTSSTLVGLEGEAGNFTARILQRANKVDDEKCITCDLCVEACPVEVPDEYNEGLTVRKAVHVLYPQSAPARYVIDTESCTRCGECVTVCPTEAIDLDRGDEEIALEVGAVIIAAGFEKYDPRPLGKYGYGRFPNVVTSTELERLFSRGLAERGRPRGRPSDGRRPERIAFVQCVGSRDAEHDYCSSACCMYATKEAVVLKELLPGLDSTIFFMDMRCTGKGYEEYYEEAQTSHGVRYIRGMPGIVEEEGETGNILITYETEGGELRTETFDILVLSTGIEPGRSVAGLAEVAGLELNRHGFLTRKPFSPETSRRGVFAVGCSTEPKDICDTVAEAGEAALLARAYLDTGPAVAERERSGAEEATAETTSPAEEAAEDERNLAAEELRTGVFLCPCGGLLEKELDLKAMTEFARGLPGVVFAGTEDLLCLESGLKAMEQKAAEAGLNRIVLGACTPRLLLPPVTKTMEKHGLTRELIEVANLREQCAWVHPGDPAGATAKAKDLLAMAVNRLRFQEPDVLSPGSRILPAILVVGGGAAGLTAALGVAAGGYRVHLVERSGELGGNLRDIRIGLGGSDPRAFLDGILRAVEENERIVVYRNARVTASTGSAGNFWTTIAVSDEDRQTTIEHGAVILATGGKELVPAEYGFGRSDRVITQVELEKRIAGGTVDARDAAMILCVGSREPDRPYCSRICCTKAVKNALALKDKDPGINVHVLYRDIRTYGFREALYREAREKGVVFTRFSLDRKPDVQIDGGKLRIETYDPLLRQPMALEPDLLVLSPAVLPNDAVALAEIFGIGCDEYGFLQEANAKFRPVEALGRDGVFLCGLAHSPRSLEETLSQARAAAAGAMAILGEARLAPRHGVARVIGNWCCGCELCIETCPYNARVLDDDKGIARVLEEVCRGCGACATACPSGASRILGSTRRQVLAMLENAFGAES